MNTQTIIRDEDLFLIPTYKKMPIALVRGEGCYVWDADDNRYLDFYGGHCVTALGHCPPRVVSAIQKQSEKLLFYSNVVYNDIRAKSARQLAEMAPLKKIFFCNSGTEAIETALKIARKSTGKTGIISTLDGFHGRTLGSLAATWNPDYRDPFHEVLPSSHYFVKHGDLESLESLLDDESDIAAVLIEPIQSIGGIIDASNAYYQGLRELCDTYKVLLIFDEIQTGVGRTGTFSISEQMGLTPDLITLAKSLGSGLPVGAVLMNDRLSSEINFGDQGTTFGGGMLAMSAVNATLETIQQEQLMDQASVIFNRIKSIVSSHGLEVRGKGCLIGIKSPYQARMLLTSLRSNGVLAGGSGDPHVMRLMPPLNTQPKHIAEFDRAFEIAIEEADPS